VTKTVDGNKVRFSYYKPASRTTPYVGGDRFVTFAEPSAPVVSSGQVGKAWRVKTAADLRAIFQ
jgi:hypothetical protein